jgi:hypothetical protein
LTVVPPEQLSPAVSAAYTALGDLITCGHALSTPYSNNERDHQAVPEQSFRPVCD